MTIYLGSLCLATAFNACHFHKWVDSFHRHTISLSQLVVAITYQASCKLAFTCEVKIGKNIKCAICNAMSCHGVCWDFEFSEGLFLHLIADYRGIKQWSSWWSWVSTTEFDLLSDKLGRERCKMVWVKAWVYHAMLLGLIAVHAYNWNQDVMCKRYVLGLCFSACCAN